MSSSSAPASVARSARTLAMLLCAAASAAAQFPWSTPNGGVQGQGQGQQGQGQQGQGQGQAPTNQNGVRLPSLPRYEDPDGLTSQWVQFGPDAFQGFPTFPPNLGGYGGYPLPPGWGQPPALGSMALPQALPGVPDWPAWVQQKNGEPLPYEVDKVVVVRQSDRVWIKAKGEDAFIPLYHWDTARGIEVGAEVKVEQKGEFLLMFHGGARLDSFGPAELSIDALDEHATRATVRSFTRFRVTAAGRPLVLALPDGSEVSTLPPEAPAAPGATGAGNDFAAALAGAAATAAAAESPLAVEPTELFLDRVDEPGRYRGRATLFNAGDRPVRWHTALGDVRIEPGHRVTFFLTPSALPLPAALVETGARAEAVGPVRRWSAAEPAVVSWSGARFQLPAGSSLQLDPMLGDPFAKPKPPTAAPTPPQPISEPKR